jgi:hypothetical protein
MPRCFAAWATDFPALTRSWRAEIVSGCNGGRPRVRPCFLALIRPSLVRSEMRRRSKCAIRKAEQRERKADPAKLSLDGSLCAIGERVQENDVMRLKNDANGPTLSPPLGLSHPIQRGCATAAAIGSSKRLIRRPRLAILAPHGRPLWECRV